MGRSPRLAFVIAVLFASTVASAQPHWRAIRGGIGGPVYAVAITAGGAIVHGTLESGPVQSTDDGATWQSGRYAPTGEAIDARVSFPIVGIAVDGAPEEILATAGSSILRSTDLGATWEIHRTGIDDDEPATAVRSLIHLDGDANLVGTSSSFWRTAGGFGGYARVIQFDVADVQTGFLRDGDEIIAGTDAGLYRFDRNGAPVATKMRGGLHAGAVIRSIAIDGGTLYAGTEAGLYRSTDRGANWSMRQLPGEIVRAVLKLAGGTIVAGTETGMHRSTDDGATWSSVIPAIEGRWATALARRDDGLIVAGSSFGVWLSRDDGATWSSASNGIPLATAYQILGLDSGVALTRIHGSTHTLYRSTNAGDSWAPVEGIPAGENVTDVTRGPDGRVAAATTAGVHLSTDGGATFVRTALDSGTRAVAIGRDGRMLASHFKSETLYLSLDDGKSWSRLEPRGHYFSMAISPEGDLYIGDGFGLRVSRDDGATWTRPVIDGRWVGAIALDRRGHVFVGTDSGVSRTTDRGATWTALEDATDDLFVDRLAPSPDGHMMMASSIVAGQTLLLSDDGGATTTTVMHDFPVIAVKSMSYDDGGHLYVMVHLGSGDYLTRTEHPLVPGVRAPIDPRDGETGTPPYVTTRWGAVTGATAYHLQLSDDALVGSARERRGASLHGAALVVDDSTLTSPERLVEQLTPDVTYYWRVRAKLESGWDLWSPVFSFTTAGGPSGVMDDPAAPLALELDGSTLRYTVTHPGPVRLTLHAIDGALTATLVDGAVDAGTHAITLPTGAHVVTLTGAGASVARVVVVR